jgi:hypothetical protein
MRKPNHTSQAALRRAARKAHAAQAKVSHTLRRHALGAPPTTNAAAKAGAAELSEAQAQRDARRMDLEALSEVARLTARRASLLAALPHNPLDKWTEALVAGPPSDAYDAALRGAHGSDSRAHIRAAGRLLWQSGAWRQLEGLAVASGDKILLALVRLEVCHCGRPNAGSKTLEHVRRRGPQLEPPPLVDVPDEG